MISKTILLAIVLAPLFGSIAAGFFGRRIGRAGSHVVTILGVAVSCALSTYVLLQLVNGTAVPFNENLYTWFQIGAYEANVGFMVDKLTAMMMVVVTFVSLLVHVYTIGYMADDPGYQRFFSYISLFTFSMLMLVMSNNFLQLFFGWEAVGLVSYLLIGFWFKKPTAIFANLKPRVEVLVEGHRRSVDQLQQHVRRKSAAHRHAQDGHHVRARATNAPAEEAGRDRAEQRRQDDHQQEGLGNHAKACSLRAKRRWSAKDANKQEERSRLFLTS